VTLVFEEINVKQIMQWHGAGLPGRYFLFQGAFHPDPERAGQFLFWNVGDSPYFCTPF